MRSACELMNAQEWYDAGDPGLIALRLAACERAEAYNRCPTSDRAGRSRLLREVLGFVGDGASVLAPLYVDYGTRTSIGAETFVNHGAYFMDGGGVTVGARCLIGPFFGAYTAAHPLIAAERATGLEKARPIVIEDDVWIGGNVVVLGGVTIGAGCVVGAGSVVTRDLPGGYVCMGSPCRPVRPIGDGDRVARG